MQENDRQRVLYDKFCYFCFQNSYFPPTPLVFPVQGLVLIFFLPLLDTPLICCFIKQLLDKVDGKKNKFNNCFLNNLQKKKLLSDLAKVWKTLHGHRAWKQGRIWTWHDNSISAADIGLSCHTLLYTDSMLKTNQSFHSLSNVQ